MFDWLLSDVQLELERAYRHFNKELFAGALSACMITIQRPPRGNILGWTSAAKIWRHQNSNEGRLELNVCPHIFHEPVEAIFEVLIHEMVHAFNSQHGIRDCSANQYHNGKFRDRAVVVGLSVSKVGYHGWAKTEIAKGGNAEKAIQSLNPKKEVFAFARQSLMLAGDNPPPPQGKSRKKPAKWSCGCQNAWVGANEFEATCKKCGRDFTPED